MSGAAEALLELLRLRDEIRRVSGRPGQHDRLVDGQNAGKYRAGIVLVGIRTEIGSRAIPGLLACPVDSRNQDGARDLGIGVLQFLVREQACEMKRADGLADRDDSLLVAAEQVDVLVDP